jgi:hypothetical protein
VAKLPCGGGEGAAHSRVVASQALAGARAPLFKLMKKLMMNGIWAIASPQAENEITLCSHNTGWLWK